MCLEHVEWLDSNHLLNGNSHFILNSNDYVAAANRGLHGLEQTESMISFLPAEALQKNEPLFQIHFQT